MSLSLCTLLLDPPPKKKKKKRKKYNIDGEEEKKITEALVGLSAQNGIAAHLLAPLSVLPNTHMRAHTYKHTRTHTQGPDTTGNSDTFFIKYS